MVRYSYLWRREHLHGQEEGSKDRPCAVLLSVVDEGGAQKVVVLPITHTPPNDPAEAVKIPTATKRRLGLDDQRSWIVLTESNRFTWPGPDLRPIVPGNPTTVAYGELPRVLYERVRAGWLDLFKAKKARVVVRTE